MNYYKKQNWFKGLIFCKVFHIHEWQPDPTEIHACVIKQGIDPFAQCCANYGIPRK